VKVWKITKQYVKLSGSLSGDLPPEPDIRNGRISGKAEPVHLYFQMGSRRQKSSDVTIIESKIEIEFFFENRIESKSIFWLVFFRFSLTAILAKITHCCEFKEWQLSCGKECWIRRLNYTNRMPQRPWWPRGSVATAASRCRVATSPTPVSLTQSLLSPAYVLRGRATACTWYLHLRVL